MLLLVRSTQLDAPHARYQVSSTRLMARLFAFCLCCLFSCIFRAGTDDKAWEAMQIVIGVFATFFVIMCAVLATVVYHWQKSGAEPQATPFAMRMVASAITTNMAYEGPNAADGELYDEAATVLTTHGKSRPMWCCAFLYAATLLANSFFEWHWCHFESTAMRHDAASAVFLRTCGMPVSMIPPQHPVALRDRTIACTAQRHTTPLLCMISHMYTDSTAARANAISVWKRVHSSHHGVNTAVGCTWSYRRRNT